jgi:tetratricopeptide (TPR) repeat protein
MRKEDAVRYVGIAFACCLTLLVANRAKADDSLVEAIEKANAALNRGDYKQAVEYYTRVIDGTSRNPKTLYFLRGESHRLGGNWRAALVDYTLAATCGMTDWDLSYSRARAHLDGKDYLMANYDYKQTIKDGKEQGCDDKALASVYNDLAWLLATCPQERHRHGESAWDYAHKAIKADPTNPDIMGTLAAAYAECGDYNAAVKWSQRAISAYKAEDKRGLEIARAQLRLYLNGKPYRDGDE